MKKWSAILSTLLAAALLLCALAPAAWALDDDAYDGYRADELLIKVGYFGGPYYDKKVFTAEEMWNMNVVYEDYTFIDNMPSVVIDHVAGVRLDDLMEAAGIDVNSIETFYFYTKDKLTGGHFADFAKTELLDKTRYCYYSLPDNFTEEGVGNASAADIAQPVPTLIGLADDWNRCINGAEFGSDYLDLNDATRFRLIYGQVDTGTRTADRSAKWIHEIDVQLGGAPTVTVDTADLDMEVGSVRRVTAAVQAADSAVAAGAQVTWSSSDEAVATVDEDGNVTMVGEGEAVITASYGSASTSFVVSSKAPEETTEPAPQDGPAPPEDKPEPEAEAPAAAPAGTALDGGSGAPAGDKPSTAPSQPAARPAAPADRKPEEKAQTEDRKLRGVTLDKAGEAAGGDTEILDGAPPAPETQPDGGEQNWRVFEMSETAQELPEIETDNPLLGFTGALSGGVLLSGAVTEAVLYRRRF